MIQCSKALILVKLEKLFNEIFKTGYYPNFLIERLLFINQVIKQTQITFKLSLLPTVQVRYSALYYLIGSVLSSKTQVFYLQQ